MEALTLAFPGFLPAAREASGTALPQVKSYVLKHEVTYFDDFSLPQELAFPNIAAVLLRTPDCSRVLGLLNSPSRESGRAKKPAILASLGHGQRAIGIHLLQLGPAVRNLGRDCGCMLHPRNPRYRAQIPFDVLYEFDGRGDHGAPASSITATPGGGSYITTARGGLHGHGAVLKIGPSGSPEPVYSFPGGEGGSTPLAAVVLGPDGRYYGTTERGGFSRARNHLRVRLGRGRSRGSIVFRTQWRSSTSGDGAR